MDKFRTEIKDRLLLLTDRNKILFATLICERLYPNYVYFQQERNWGDINKLKNGITLLHQAILGNHNISKDEIEQAIFDIDKVTPDTNEFSGITTSFALDACNSVYSTLNFLLHQNIEDILDVATYARDTVDMFIQERDDMDYNVDTNFELKISSDPFMIAEISRQKDTIAKLRLLNNDKIGTPEIELLRDPTPIISINSLYR